MYTHKIISDTAISPRSQALPWVLRVFCSLHCAALSPVKVEEQKSSLSKLLPQRGYIPHYPKFPPERGTEISVYKNRGDFHGDHIN